MFSRVEALQKAKGSDGACTSVHNRFWRRFKEETHDEGAALTSVCWVVQRPSSGSSAAREVSGARAQSRESRRRDRLMDTRTHFCSNARGKDQLNMQGIPNVASAQQLESDWAVV